MLGIVLASIINHVKHIKRGSMNNIILFSDDILNITMGDILGKIKDKTIKLEICNDRNK
jgi:hypothetical protein